MEAWHVGAGALGFVAGYLIAWWRHRRRRRHLSITVDYDHDPDPDEG